MWIKGFVCVCVPGAEIGQGEYGSVLKGVLTEYKGKKGKVRCALSWKHLQSTQYLISFKHMRLGTV